MEGLVPECWRAFIVAGRRRKSRATFGTPAIVSLVNWPPFTIHQAGAGHDRGGGLKSAKTLRLGSNPKNESRNQADPT
jgi:hypothetical protein